jgi:hypothetical protein
MKTEDIKSILSLVDQSTGTEPKFDLPFSIQLLASMHQSLTKKTKGDIVVAFGSKTYGSVMGSDGFIVAIEPRSREEVLTGYVATMFGMHLITDAYFTSDELLLPANCLYVLKWDGERIIDQVSCFLL